MLTNIPAPDMKLLLLSEQHQPVVDMKVNELRLHRLVARANMDRHTQCVLCEASIALEGGLKTCLNWE